MTDRHSQQRRPRRRVGAPLPALLLAGLGCATPYQKMGVRGGYEDYQAGKDAFFVRYSGNAHTSKGTILRYWHRRAAEICGGEDRFVVVSMETGATQETFGDSTTTYEGTTQAIGQTSYHTGTVTTQDPITVTEHEASGYIRCESGPGDTRVVFDDGYQEVLDRHLATLHDQREYCNRLLATLESKRPAARNDRLWRAISLVPGDLGVLVTITTTWRDLPNAATVAGLAEEAEQAHRRIAERLQTGVQLLGPNSRVGERLREAAEYHQTRAVQSRALRAQL